MENQLKEHLKKSINENKLSHAFLVETTNCEETMREIYQAFVECKAISNEKIENNLSVQIISPENNIIDKNKILQLQKFIIIKSQQKYKIYFIINAELMNPVAANKLLKSLEEPADNVIGFLLVQTSNVLLETIKSRCVHYIHPKIEKSTKDNQDYIRKLNQIDKLNYIEKYEFKKALTKKDKIEIISILEDYQTTIINSQINNHLAKKYKIIDNTIEYLKANVNIELCLDKMIIEMEKQKWKYTE